jgi:hypothetical protein
MTFKPEQTHGGTDHFYPLTDADENTGESAAGKEASCSINRWYRDSQKETQIASIGSIVLALKSIIQLREHLR